MPKQKDIETIYNDLQELLANADDDLKLRVYDELLQTGSVTLTNDSNDAHVFSIGTFNHTIANDEPTEIDIDYDLIDLEVLKVSEDVE